MQAQPTMAAEPKAQPTMKAVVFHKYGPPEQLEFKDIEKPVVEDDNVLVRVRAVSVNALDWRLMRGRRTWAA